MLSEYVRRISPQKGILGLGGDFYKNFYETPSVLHFNRK